MFSFKREKHRRIRNRRRLWNLYIILLYFGVLFFSQKRYKLPINNYYSTFLRLLYASERNALYNIITIIIYLSEFILNL